MKANENQGLPSPIRQVLGRRDFRLLWIGEGISLLGDQFYMIALPWLVLKITGDALAVGGVLAIAGIPRALFMLVGGAVTDRFSSRSVMLASNILRMFLVIILTILVLSGEVNLWMIYVLAGLFGLVDAFFFPAQSSIVPHLVDKEHLQIGNSIIQGTAQLSRFAGPVLAGALIAIFASKSGSLDAGSESIPDLTGIGIAFAVDALTFLISAVTLWMISFRPLLGEGGDEVKSDSVWSSIFRRLDNGLER